MIEYTAKWPDEAGIIHWTPEENATWETLFERQYDIVQGRACSAFLQGLDQLNLNPITIPQIPDINQSLQETGWKMLAVAGTIDVTEFFMLLSKKNFPVANFIRIPEELDYLQQPDVFHEFFGHGPLLMDAVYADFMQWYGEFALTLTQPQQRILSRLFWFTMEFGLMHAGEHGLRIYGGGILSSYEETQYAISSPVPKRHPFDLAQILDTPYNYQEIQKCYYVIHSLEDLFALQNNHSELMKQLSHYKGNGSSSFINC